MKLITKCFIFSAKAMENNINCLYDYEKDSAIPDTFYKGWKMVGFCSCELKACAYERRRSFRVATLCASEHSQIIAFIAL